MHKTSVFIDGAEGTTGLRMADRLAKRDDVSLIKLAEAERKNTAARAAALNGCDIAVLCLPDAAAVEAVELIKNTAVKVIDASTAHRVADGWTYGLAELNGAREKIANSNRVAVPGCHAGGFIALARPLVERGIIAPETPLKAFSLTGYSGGGKKMIAEYENPTRSGSLAAPRLYALAQQHKHLREMTAVSGLKTPPVFTPIVCDFYSGMAVTVMLAAEETGGRGASELLEIYSEYYGGNPLIKTLKNPESAMLNAASYSGRDDMGIAVEGNAERITLTALFDNLGKGASGSAVQIFNLMVGAPETASLVID